MRHECLCAGLALLLAGCAQDWEKPGAGTAEFKAARGDCEARANDRYPPAIQTITVGGGYRMADGHYVPPQFGYIDRNEVARVGDLRSCFYENGWRPTARP